jgi:hypothetical protein
MEPASRGRSEHDERERSGAARARGAPSAFTSELHDATQLREPQVIRRVVAVDAGTGATMRSGIRATSDFQVVTETGLPSRGRAPTCTRVDAYPGRAVASGKAPNLGPNSTSSSRDSVRPRVGDPRHVRSARLPDPVATAATNARQTVEFAPAGSKFDLRPKAARARPHASLRTCVLRDTRDGTLRLRNLGGGFRLVTSGTMDGTRRWPAATPGALSRLAGAGWTRPRDWTGVVGLLIGRGRQDSDLSLMDARDGRGRALRPPASGGSSADGRAWGRTNQYGSYQPGPASRPAPRESHRLRLRRCRSCATRSR